MHFLTKWMDGGQLNCPHHMPVQMYGHTRTTGWHAPLLNSRAYVLNQEACNPLKMLENA